MLGVGTLLGGRYRLIRPIGEGGAGMVYEARHEEIGKPVAVKLLHAEVAHEQDIAERFKREACAVAAIGHLSILDVFDIGHTDEGTLFLVMELLRGETLRDRLHQKGVLELDLAVYVVCHMLTGLEAAHQASIVHRDVKPENVFLVRTGQRRPGVKLLDFGISRMMNRTLEEIRLTRTNTILGTPLYMSPEQAAGSRDVDALTDIYAAGAVLYECVTGRPPFMADNFLALASQIQSEDPEPPSALRSEVSTELEAQILRAMAKDRADRFPTALAFLDALVPMLSEVDVATLSIPEAEWLDKGTASLYHVTPEESAVTEPLSSYEQSGEPAEPSAAQDTLEPATRNSDDAVTVSPRRWLPLAIVAFVVVGVAGAAVVIAVNRDDPRLPERQSRHESQGPVSSVAAASTPVAAASSDAQAGADGAAHSERDAAVTSVPAKVVITLEGVPEGAHVKVADQTFHGATFSLVRDDRQVPIEVSAPSYHTWRGTVSARHSTSKRITLQKRSRAPRRDSAASETEPPRGPGGLPAFDDGP